MEEGVDQDHVETALGGQIEGIYGLEVVRRMETAGGFDVSRIDVDPELAADREDTLVPGPQPSSRTLRRESSGSSRP